MKSRCSGLFLLLVAIVLVAALPSSRGHAASTITQVNFKFPWQAGDTKYWTGGPHSPFQAGLSCPSPPATPVAQGSGLDFAGPASNPRFEVLAMAGGIVRQAGWLQQLAAEIEAWGDGVEIDLGNGYQIMYAHMDASLTVQPGQRIEQGHPLGWSSNTGGSWPVHLHVELRTGGQMVNGTWQRGQPAPWDAQLIDGWTVRSWAVRGDPTQAWNYEGTMTQGAIQVIAEDPCGGNPSFPGSKTVAVDGISWKQAASGALPGGRNILTSTNQRLFPFQHWALPNLR